MFARAERHVTVDPYHPFAALWFVIYPFWANNNVFYGNRFIMFAPYFNPIIAVNYALSYFKRAEVKIIFSRIFKVYKRFFDIGGNLIRPAKSI